MKPSQTRIAVLSSIFGILFALSGAVCGETTIEDTFSLKDREAGLPLNGTATEKGGLVWEATKNVVLNGSKDSGYVALADGGCFSARVALPESATEISVEASLHPDPVAADGVGNWLAVGIGNPQLGAPTWGQGVFLCVSSKGPFACFFNTDPRDWRGKQNMTIKSWVIPRYRSAVTRAKLVYHVKDHTVSAWINDEPVLEDEPVPSDPALVDPVYTGFSGFGQQSNVNAVSAFRSEAK